MPDERAAEVEPAPHAARVRFHDAIRGVVEVELREKLGGAALRLASRETVEAPEHDEVLAAGEVLVDCRVLTGEADERPDGLRLAHDVVSRDGRVARVGPQQRREDAHGRRLAGAVRSEQPENRSLRDDEVDAVEGADLSLPGAVDLHEAFGLNGVHGLPIVAPRVARERSEIHIRERAIPRPRRSRG